MSREATRQGPAEIHKYRGRIYQNDLFNRFGHKWDGPEWNTQKQLVDLGTPPYWLAIECVATMTQKEKRAELKRQIDRMKHPAVTCIQEAI